MVSWYGLWGPPNLPREISAKLSAEVARAVKSPQAQERLGDIGFDPVGSTGAEFAAYIKDEIARYAKIVKEANIKAE
jgi:tripartite-type tricarboxylate transporter receptor subunit TctC